MEIDVTFIAEAIINYKTTKNKVGICELLNIALDKTASENYVFNAEVEELLRIKDLDVKGILEFMSKIKIGNKHTRKHIAIDETYNGHSKQHSSNNDDDADISFDILEPSFRGEFKQDEQIEESTNVENNSSVIFNTGNDVTEIIGDCVEYELVEEEEILEDKIEIEIKKIEAYSFLSPIELNVYLVNYDKLLLTNAVKNLPLKIFQYYLKLADLKVKMYKSLASNN